MLKSYACRPENSKGRIYPEKPTLYRNDFERDRDRIIHANAFKRLQYKTQVFINHKGDHYRNRMTHSIEVSSIARSLCKALGLSEDLAEGVALAHDLGHTPFGHAGEDALNECMKDFGGFSHNAHSFKILTKIEQKYAAYNGLNLTWEVLEAIVKHNGPMKDMGSSYAYVYEYDKKHNLDLGRYSSAEAQVASLSDDIAYICHDLEDSIKAEILSYVDFEEIEFIDRYIHEVKKDYQDVDDERLIYEVGRKLAHHLIESLLEQTRLNLERNKIKTEQDIRCLGKQIVDFTESANLEVKQIKDFLMRKVYKHHLVASVTLQSRTVIHDLFKLYSENIDLLPFSWRVMIDEQNIISKMSVIADYIAGMTDRFAIKQYQTFYNFNFANIDI
jgi:dGTPase